MHCFRCQAENVDGSRFCGNCGASFGTIPPADGNEPALHATDSTRQMAAGVAASSGLPRLSKGGRPIVREDAGMTGESLGSLGMPASSGSRVLKVMLIVVLDLAMAGAGVGLLLRSDCGGGGSAKAEEATAKPVAGVDGGVVVVVDTRPDAASGGGGGGGAGSNVVGSGGGSGSGRGSAGTGAGSGTGTGTGTGTGSGTGSSVRIDAGIDVLRPDATPAASAPDAGTTSGTPDAAVAAPAIDASTEGTFTADDIGDQVNVALASSQNRLSRCYTQATKALPDDQPLSGEVDIAFEVMPTGATQGVAVARNTTGSNTLANCLAGVVEDWEFSRFTGESLDFQRTFRFKPAQ